MSWPRRTVLAFAAAGGLLVGIVATLAVTTPTKEAVGSATTSPSATATISTEPTTTSTTSMLDASTTLLVWTSGGLPAGFAGDVARIDGVEHLTAVSGDQTDLVASTSADGTPVDRVDDGWAIPLDTIAIDPVSFGRFAPPDARASIESLEPGDALLTESSAKLRQLTTGATMELRGGVVEIAGVIDDTAGAGAELLISTADATRLGVITPRYLLISHPSDARPAVTQSIAEHAGSRSIRFRSPVETTWMRHGDAVTPPVYVKQAYGEFAYRDRPGRDVEIDPAWVDAHIVDAHVPILGQVRCHRATIEPLSEALGALAEENLGHLVDPGGFAGCWSARRIAVGEPLSRHAWGVAVDLNIGGNPRGSFSTQDPRLVEAMRAAEFTWGGLWLIPDPGHYELIPD